MDALLRTVDARVSVIDTQLALRDALDVLDRTGTNSPEVTTTHSVTTATSSYCFRATKSLPNYSIPVVREGQI